MEPTQLTLVDWMIRQDHAAHVRLLERINDEFEDGDLDFVSYCEARDRADEHTEMVEDFLRSCW